MTEVTPAIHPERGFLHSFRSWRDIFPWLGITDALRVATSLFALLLVSVGLLLSLLVHLRFETLPGQFESDLEIGFATSATRDVPVFEPGKGLRCVIGPVYQWARWDGRGVPQISVISQVVHQVILLLIWVIPIGFIVRQSGLSLAGRPLRGTKATLAFVLSRWRGYLSTLVIPAVALALILSYFCVAFMTSAIPVAGPWISYTLQLLGFPLAIAAGLIGFGGLVALPLAWAAVTLESDGSGFDAISRGFEYTLRRPLHWIGYGAIAGLVIVMLGTLASGVAAVAFQVIRLGRSLVASILPVSVSDDLAAWLVFGIPAVVEITVFFCLISWLYLLLRRSTNGQEIEDLWEQPIERTVALPKLKVDQ